MNDTSELVFGLNILEMVIAHGEAAPLGTELRDRVLMAIASVQRSTSNLHVLTASFCLKGNVLSQWRAYARQDGLAIAFDKSHLSTVAAAQGFITGPVHYFFSGRERDLPQEQRLPAWITSRAAVLTRELATHAEAVERFEAALQAGNENVPFAATTEQDGIITQDGLWKLRR
jgi:hypothetical protein